MIAMYNETIKYLKTKFSFTPLCAVILGTGLGELAHEVENKVEIPYEDIPGFVRSTAPSHQGVLIAGSLYGVPVVVFKGRFHFYEGYTMQQVVYPVRVARLLGAKFLFVTNAAGSLNKNLRPGQLVRISDHINMMGANPLVGSNVLTESIVLDGETTNMFGERFVSMHAPYDKKISAMADTIANENNIILREGIYCAVSGPAFETQAECFMIKNWGADLVGMSTVPEVIAAVHCGMRVFAVSVVTNLSNIFHSDEHSQEEIQINADKAGKKLLILFEKLLELLAC